MVNEHFKILKQGVRAWNEWRRQNAALRPELRGANLTALKIASELAGSSSAWSAFCRGSFHSPELLRRPGLGQDDLLTRFGTWGEVPAGLGNEESGESDLRDLVNG